MAKTRLTKTMRAEILYAVLAATKGLHTTRANIEADIKEAVVQALRASQPAGFYALIQHAPKEWFSASASEYWNENPLWKMQQTVDPSIYRNQHIVLDDPVSVAPGHGICLHDMKNEPVFSKLVARADKWCAKYSQTRAELNDFLQSCATVEMLVDRMPELAKFVPAKAVVYPLVAPSNLLSTLLSEGFEPA